MDVVAGVASPPTTPSIETSPTGGDAFVTTRLRQSSSPSVSPAPGTRPTTAKLAKRDGMIRGDKAVVVGVAGVVIVGAVVVAAARADHVLHVLPVVAFEHGGVAVSIDWADWKRPASYFPGASPPRETPSVS